jgi:cytochrome c oxidase subunit 2
MKVIKRALIGIAAIGGWLVTSVAHAQASAAPAQADGNVLDFQTSVARDLYSLHTVMLIVCLLIFIGVFGVMLYSILVHRRAKAPKTVNFHKSTTVEVIWTIVPFLIIIGMAIPATKTVIAMKDAANADVVIKVTGYERKWGFDYLWGPGTGIHLTSTRLAAAAEPANTASDAAPVATAAAAPGVLDVDQPLVVPVGKRIRLVSSAADIHRSWTVPAFGGKRDVLPSLARDTWFEADKVGIYHGYCPEWCGKDYAVMPVVVEVLSQDDYAKWIKAKR